MIINLAKYRAEKKKYIIKTCPYCKGEGGFKCDNNVTKICEECKGNGFLECISEFHPDFKLID